MRQCGFSRPPVARELSVPLGTRRPHCSAPRPPPRNPSALLDPAHVARNGRCPAPGKAPYCPMTFEELNLAPAILKAVHEQGYEIPTPIQAQAIPAVLEGHDLLGGAQTGTGKTAAFTPPMLNKLTIRHSRKNKFSKDGIAALVLTPTRELAAQVEESIRTY